MITHELILRDSGNTYVGSNAWQLRPYVGSNNRLPTFKLDESEKYFVVELINGEIVTRAGQSSRENAMKYYREGRVIVSMEYGR